MKKQILFAFALIVSRIAFSAEYYVDPARPDDTGAATNWATAKQTIQAAVDLTVDGDMVWVAVGTYQLSSAIFVTNAIIIQSVSGADETIVSGNASNSCFVLSNACIVSGLTVKNGKAAEGGGVYCATGEPKVFNCVVTENRAGKGGGVFRGKVENCKVYSNGSWGAGGGLYYVSAWNSLIYSNTASSYGGGAYYGTLVNCTVVANKASHHGCGVFGGHIKNSIVWENYYNIYSVDVAYATVSSSCVPGIDQGSYDDDKSITSDPLLSSTYYISETSPCRAAGTSEFSSGVDLEGKEWLAPPSMGCYELYESISMKLNGPTNICTGFAAAYELEVNGPVENVYISFGDGLTITNGLQFEKAWSSSGNYNVVFYGSGPDYPQELIFTQIVSVLSQENSTVYVSKEEGDDLSDGTSWANAKKTIEDGIEAQNYFKGIVLISNGVYSVNSEICVEKSVYIESLNGVDTVFVDGNRSNRCFNLGNSDCLLAGITIRNGYSADNGGGIYSSSVVPTISNCVFRGSFSDAYGGGLYKGTAIGCVFLSNQADLGGGMYSGAASNCMFLLNQAEYGGGKYEGFACNSLFKENVGGGAYGGKLNHCTIIYNSGLGGAYLKATNSIFSYNERNLYVSYPDDIVSCFVGGDPLIDSNGCLEVNSPCRGAGLFDASVGTDFEGEFWLNPPSIGCDELHGEILLDITSQTNVCIKTPVPISASVRGSQYLTTIDFGDGEVWTNVMNSSKSWLEPGGYDIVFSVFNDDYPEGTSQVHSVQIFPLKGTEKYVSTSNGDDNADGDSWNTAKATIQAGVNAQNLYGGIVFVSNGLYKLDETIVVGDAIRVKAGANPLETIIDAQSKGKAFLLRGTGSLLSGMSIINGVEDHEPVRGYYGAGVFCDGFSNNHIITNCIITGNVCCDSGGGIAGGTLYNCIVSDNFAYDGNGGGVFLSKSYDCIIQDNISRYGFGGGLYGGYAENNLILHNFSGLDGGGICEGEIVNCTVVDNYAYSSGGVDQSIVRNSILYSNHVTSMDVNHDSLSTLYNSYSRSDETNSLCFIDPAGGDYRLQSFSPCINAGNNDYISTRKDLGGGSRIIGGVVDVGAYERQDIGPDVDLDGLADLWEMQNFGSRYSAVPDTICSNRVNTIRQAYIAGLDPHDPDSRFQGRMGMDRVLRWNATSGRVYSVWYSTNLLNGFQCLETNIPWSASCFTNSSNGRNGYYKIDVRLK